ncbi:hypothetical protein B0I12_003594 [Microbacterium hydrothermale]|uniref:Transposase n=1 Tax=Microbacterium enclense TaxID=993073 RepID=A0A3S3P1I8_9MICO|nr:MULTISPECIES: hypothetical protein [Microbacterium]MCW2166421.1 hypothetical protein [Microbacterium hydrothermale]PTT15134.1 hypothetical protein DBR36_15260 [Microbacterium sp. HMWF026]RWR15943.1 hypothetical protein D8Y23_14825 [Microbacterium enclense]
MPKPYPREFRDDVVRVARGREDGVTIKQIATDFGVRRAFPNSNNRSAPTVRTIEGSWVRDPAWSIAAVRDVDEPTEKLPCAPASPVRLS